MEELLLNSALKVSVLDFLSSEMKYNRIQIVLSIEKYTISCACHKNLTQMSCKLK